MADATEHTHASSKQTKIFCLALGVERRYRELAWQAEKNTDGTRTGTYNMH